MGNAFFDNPPALQGNSFEQIDQLYRYLSTVSEQLNQAMNSISTEQLAEDTVQMIREQGTEAAEGQRETLKSLIVKTADVVRTEIDEVRTTLQTRSQAISDQFGVLETNLSNEITARAEGLQQAFTYIEMLAEAAEGSETFQNKFSSYVNVGVIRIDQGRPITGIAIGENITNPDGTINQNNRMATFTVDRLSFYQNGSEVAYFANNTFHIASGEVTRSMKMGNHTWTVLTGGALALIAGQ